MTDAAIEAMPAELHASPVSLSQAIDDLTYALEATEDGRLRDARLCAERAKTKLLFAQRSVQTTVAHWQEYNQRLNRLRSYVAEHERCAFCAASEVERPELGPVRWRPGWLPHVVMHDRCAVETARGGLD